MLEAIIMYVYIYIYIMTNHNLHIDWNFIFMWHFFADEEFDPSCVETVDFQLPAPS